MTIKTSKIKESEILQRQGLVTSPAELRFLAEQLEKEYKDQGKGLPDLDLDHKCQVAIVNKSKYSDTWVFDPVHFEE